MMEYAFLVTFDQICDFSRVFSSKENLPEEMVWQSQTPIEEAYREAILNGEKASPFSQIEDTELPDLAPYYGYREQDVDSLFWISISGNEAEFFSRKGEWHVVVRDHNEEKTCQYRQFFEELPDATT